MGLFSSIFGGSSSKSSPSSVWGPQAPYLQGLYQAALMPFMQQTGMGFGYGQTPQPGQAPAAPGGPQAHFYGGGLIRPPLGDSNKGGGFNIPSPGGMQPIGQYSQNLVNGLVNNQSNYMTNNPYLSQQIQGFGADLGNFYQNQILPGIQSSAGIAGQFGGSRQGVAAGIAGQDLGRQFAQGATQMRSNAYDTGISNLGQLYNLGMAPYQAMWQPFQNLQGMIGNPAILGGGSQASQTNGILGWL